MSYALHLAADARHALASLPFEVQEEVLDVLEGIANEADSVVAEDVAVQHLVYRTDRQAVYIRIYCTIFHDVEMIALDRLVAVVVVND